MSNELRPGDMAVVVGTNPSRGINGLIVVVTSTPYLARAIDEYYRAFIGCFVNVNGLPPNSEWTDTRLLVKYLIRLPPDDECKRLFRETERPVAA